MAVPAPSISKAPAHSSNYRVGRPVLIDQITFHHIVGDAPGAIGRFQTAGQNASSTYVISKTGKIYQCVAESNTPYTDGNMASSQRAITIEHAGGHPSVPYTAEMYKASAHLCAWIMSRRKITRFKRHRDVSLLGTACPGNLDVERIVRDARAMIEKYKEVPMPNMTKTQLNQVYQLTEKRNATAAEVTKYTKWGVFQFMMARLGVMTRRWLAAKAAADDNALKLKIDNAKIQLAEAQSALE